MENTSGEKRKYTVRDHLVADDRGRVVVAILETWRDIMNGKGSNENTVQERRKG